uniref:Uncharacterized protein n=1 Tax=Candidatus Kentrum sp. LPFa TaxID=2126335 RepID=A0A450WSZ9_9GAMM|nr:MAG: hypothetical protein BECKLPF1236B_GA0070989_12001 [Candidatus Kentron sp. LPFa]
MNTATANPEPCFSGGVCISGTGSARTCISLPRQWGGPLAGGVVELLEDRESRGKTRAIETRSKN